MPPLVVDVLRAKDLFHAQFEFINLTLDTTIPAKPVLRRAGTGRAFIVIRLPPQHIADRVFDGGTFENVPHQAFLSCPTRIAFELRANSDQVDFSVSGLLAEIAKSTITPGQTSEPIPITAIEFPDRLLISPRTTARLNHQELPTESLQPATRVRWTPLWHSLMSDNAEGGLRFRAVANAADTGRPTETSLSLDQRRIIVQQCSGSNPHLISSSQFMLTPLGATARLKSAWSPSAVPNLASWEHETVTGRDQFVRTVEQGFLFPFGHRATKTVIKRRDFVALGGTTWISQIQKHVIINVDELERHYDRQEAINGYDNDGREMPVKQVRIVAQPEPATNERDPIRLKCTVADVGGNVIDCELTMLFVPHGTASLDSFVSTYRNQHSSVPTSPQRIALADDREAPGATSFTVTELKFDAKPFSIGGALQPPFLPLVRGMKIIIPAVEKLLGSSANAISSVGAPTCDMTFHRKYLDHGFDAIRNPAQVFAQFQPAIPEIKIPAERAGGITAPKFMPMNGLSRVRGLVSDVERAASNQIDLNAMLGETKLLGAITIKKIINALGDNLPVTNLDQLFKDIDRPNVFATRPVLSTIQTGAGVEVRFLWKPSLNTTGLPEPLVTNGAMGLTVKGCVRTSREAAVPSFEVDGKLTNFGLKFGDLLTVNFKEVAFNAGASSKLNLKTDIAGIAMGPGLQFIQKLQGLLSTGGLGKGPTIEPALDGVVVRFGVAIPSFAVGVLSIQNIALGTSVSLPFVERPAAVRLSLSERSNPFLVSVSIFGGTGFFALEMRTDDTILIEASIEFGGIVSINLLGIVSGAVYVFVGIYFSVGGSKDIAVSGHLRFGGYVDVAGLISVSVEFYIALTYRTQDKVLLGEGRLTISVKILFFSLKQTFSISRKISGFGDAPGEGLAFAEADQPALPNFTTTMTPDQWYRYCSAFA